MNNKNVDIIIPTFQPGAKLDLLVEGLLRQTVLPDKIIIINTDESLWPEGMAEDPRVELHHIGRDEFNHGATRNQGVRYSGAPYFICMTQDAVPADRFLIEKILAPLDEEVRLSYARQIPGADADSVECVTREFNYPETSFVKSAKDLQRLGIKTYYCSNVCAAYDRAVFDSLGGFQRVDFNEDMLYAAAVIHNGYSISYCADARVFHSHQLNGVQQFKRNRILGKSQKEHPEVFAGVRSESEGIRLVGSSAKKLLIRGKWYCIPKLVWLSGCKFVGYRIGKS